MGMRGIPLDAQTNVVKECFALVHTPRRSRKRFPAGNVEVVESQEQALAQADPARNLHAARVAGPSKSSENVQIYYLLAWLQE